MHSPTHILQKRWKVVFFGGIILAAISLGISLIMPLEYRADAQVLIIARQQYGVDPFTVSKSAERIADTLASTIETDAFYNQVMENNAVGDVREDYQSLNNRERREKWQRSVDASAVFGTNLLNVSVFDTDPDNAQLLASAVAKTVVESGSDYVGTVIVGRVVNEPIATNWPVRPNILLNMLLGFVVGLFAMGWMVIRKHGAHLG